MMMTITLQSGTEVPLSLNFKLQSILRKERPAEYKKYSDALMAMKDGDLILPWTDIIYVAYLCAAIGKGKLKEAMSEDEFLEDLPEDTNLVMKVGKELIFPNGKTASENHSDKQ